jgi:hypothetical protein
MAYSCRNPTIWTLFIRGGLCPILFYSAHRMRLRTISQITISFACIAGNQRTTSPPGQFGPPR